MSKNMKKLTVGDTSNLVKDEDVCVVRRKTLADMEVGEEVAIRFKDEFSLSPYRTYRLEEKYVKDEWDESQGYWTCKFRRVKTDAGSVLLGALVALVVGAMGAMTLLLAASIVTGRALI